MSREILLSHRETWKKKPLLRLLYSQWYEQIAAELVDGTTLEIGGGSGNLKEFAPHVICSDLVEVPWLDVAADAQCLPFTNNSFDNIVLFDVIHHLELPCRFLDEAQRVLRPGGRIVIMDPYVSWASWPVYHFLHAEPVDLGQNPFVEKAPSADRKPFDANQALSRLLFEKHMSAFQQRYHDLQIKSKHYLSFIAYPLSGGFDHPSLLPMVVAKGILRLERLLEPLGRFMAFRILITLEKTD